MTKKFIYPLLTAALAGLLVVGIILAWTEPSTAPPGGNVFTPLNVSSSTQYKAGALGIGGVFRAYTDAIFDGKVGIGTTAPQAALEVSSTASGMLAPRMTTAQRDAIAGPANGLMIYNLTTKNLEVYDGSSWKSAQGGGLLDVLNSNSDASEFFGDVKIGSGSPGWVNLGDQGAEVRAMAIYNSRLYIGQGNGGVKSYDGSSWVDLGDQGNNVRAMAVYNNKLYIGQTDGKVKSYDGSSWVDLGTQGNWIEAMTVYNSKIYIGQTDGKVKSYDGSSWVDLGSQGAEVRAMALYNNKLYIGQYDGKVKSYDGSSWVDLGDQGDIINTMALYNNKLYIGQTDGKVKSYDGSSWVDLGDQGEMVNAMAVVPMGKLYIGHNDGKVKTYDGSSWVDLGDQGDSVRSMAVYNSKLYIGQYDGSVRSYTLINLIIGGKVEIAGYKWYDFAFSGGYFKDGENVYIRCVAGEWPFSVGQAKIRSGVLYTRARYYTSGALPPVCDSGWQVGYIASCASSTYSATTTASVGGAYIISTGCNGGGPWAGTLFSGSEW